MSKQKYLVTVGYTTLAFDDRELAMRLYGLLTESTPVTSVYCYGDMKAPDSLKGVSYVRKTDDVAIELTRVDASTFALHLTEAEYHEKCKVRPTELEVEMRLVEEVQVRAIAGPDDGESTVSDVEPS